MTDTAPISAARAAGRRDRRPLKYRTTMEGAPLEDAALIYFGNEAPNGMSLTAEELDILRTAFEIAFQQYEDDEELSQFFNPEVVWRVGRRIEEAYAGSLPQEQVPA